MDVDYLREVKKQCLIAAVKGYTSKGLTPSDVMSNAIEIANNLTIDDRGNFVFIPSLYDE